MFPGFSNVKVWPAQRWLKSLPPQGRFRVVKADHDPRRPDNWTAAEPAKEHSDVTAYDFDDEAP